LPQHEKIAAAERRTNIKILATQALEMVFNDETVSHDQTASALIRLLAGYYLGDKPLSRELA
jgi:hypothetical protein